MLAASFPAFKVTLKRMGEKHHGAGSNQGRCSGNSRLRQGISLPESSFFIRNKGRTPIPVVPTLLGLGSWMGQCFVHCKD